MLTAVIFDIQRNSFVDGPGIRTTVFFKGCNLKCAWCHNPESQELKSQMMFYKDKCKGCGKCKEVCPHHFETCDLCGKCTLYCSADARKICGREYTVDEIFAEIIKDQAYYDNSGGGVTFSGGECMLQVDFLCEILKKCKKSGVHTAVDTAGDVDFARFERIMPYTDLFLYDIKACDERLHKEYTGVSNRRILKNLESLLEAGASVYVRIPIIPGVNDSSAEVERIGAFLRRRKPEKIELLPYHRMGEHKYEALNREAQTFPVPDKDEMQRIRETILK